MIVINDANSARLAISLFNNGVAVLHTHTHKAIKNSSKKQADTGHDVSKVPTTQSMMGKKEEDDERQKNDRERACFCEMKHEVRSKDGRSVGMTRFFIFFPFFFLSFSRGC